MLKFPPERIVCLSSETVETIYRLCEEKRIVGVTGYASRPKRVRKEKSRVSSFKSMKVKEILDLRPDIIFTFSDVQANLSRDLMLAGLNVFCFNQRSVAGILSMITMIGAILDCTEKAKDLTNELVAKIKKYKSKKPALIPKVYFEEWDEPLISAIRWVSEIVEIAGGTDVFSEKSVLPRAESRYVFSSEVVNKNPDIILAS
ncbi:MAG: ABC transporter substrate-binding protein [Paracoccaceae bacterium]|nr:ABC transporter substrate-binding protein [Paracoccaceae bacterium]